MAAPAGGIFNPTCYENQPTYTQGCCIEPELGRIDAIAFVHKSLEFDMSDPAEWATQIANGNVILIQNIRAETDGGKGNRVDGFGRRKDVIIDYDFAAEYVDYNWQVNHDFYEALKWNTNYRVALFTERYVWDCRYAPTYEYTTPVAGDLGTPNGAVIKLNWSGRLHQKMYERPEIDLCLNPPSDGCCDNQTADFGAYFEDGGLTFINQEPPIGQESSINLCTVRQCCTEAISIDKPSIDNFDFVVAPSIPFGTDCIAVAVQYDGLAEPGDYYGDFILAACGQTRVIPIKITIFAELPT